MKQGTQQDDYHKAIQRGDISTGSYYSSGGIMGDLHALQKTKSGSNLSEQNVQTFEDILGKYLKKRPTNLSSNTPVLSRKNRLSAIQEAERRMHRGELSTKDIEDFKHVVGVLGEIKHADLPSNQEGEQEQEQDDQPLMPDKEQEKRAYMEKVLGRRSTSIQEGQGDKPASPPASGGHSIDNNPLHHLN